MPFDYSQVQEDIDAIVGVGDIRTYVDAISLLFPDIYGAYIGSDGKPHMISYYVNQTLLSGVGYIPVGTDASALFKIDTTQKQYSMQPIINYMNSYNLLSAYASFNNLSNIELNLGTYNQYIGSYNSLKAYLDSFDNHYTATLFQFATSQDDLGTNMGAIKTQLFYPVDMPPNITTYINNLITDFAQTTPYMIGQAEQSVVALSRSIAYEKRRGENIVIPG